MKSAILIPVLALIPGASASGQRDRIAVRAHKLADQEKPDFGPIPARPMNGKVVVKNIGRGLANPAN
jgi:hypothetical protein